MRRLTGLLGLLLAVACLAPTSALAGTAHEYERSFGPDCTSGTQFSFPGAIAVDEETHDVYVADLNAQKVYRCTEGGAKADFSAGPGAGTNEIGGFAFGEGETCSQIAVDPNTHDFYVADYLNEVLKAYHQDGEPAEFTAGPGAGTNEIPLLACGVAVDQNGAIYVGNLFDFGSGFSGVKIYAPSGEELNSFESIEAANVAVDSNGAVYVAHYAAFGEGEVKKYTPDEFPVTSTTGYSAPTVVHAIPPSVYSIAVDPTTNDLYMDERVDAEHSRIVQLDETGQVLTTFAESGPGGLTMNACGPFECFSEGVAIDGAGGNVYASNPGAPYQVEVFAPPPAEPPTVLSTRVANATTTSANFEAQVNPEFFPTHFHFEYLTEAEYQENGETFAGAKSTGEVNLGASGEAQTTRGHAEGLSPDTAYRFRVVATNDNGVSTSEPPARFSTFAAFPPSLPDGRAYEMVSPAQKLGEMIPPDPSTFLGGSCEQCLPGANEGLMPMQSTPDGEAVAYVGQPFFVGLAAGLNEYRSRRTPGGWGTQGLSSPQFQGTREGLAGYQAFSPDLSRAVIAQRENPALSPEAPTQEGRVFANLYLRSEGGALKPLITGAPPVRPPEGAGLGTPFAVEFRGANSGISPATALTHVIFEANDALTAATADAPAAPSIAAGERNLYEWSDGELRLVNVLPGNAGTAIGVFGSGTLLNEGEDLNNAISEDGSRIFWSDKATGQLYVRIDGKETRKVEDPGKYVTASKDGSKVLLGDGCLYDVDAEACEADLTQGNGAVSFKGTMGGSEDLSRVYFVDTAAFAGAPEAGTCQNAATKAEEEIEGEGKLIPGKGCNLYLYDEGATTFIATLLARDNDLGGPAGSGLYGSWSAPSSARTAQVSPDGRHLAFMSKAAQSLVGYENVRSSGKECGAITPACAQVFEYDAASADLACASCNPSGARPLGLSNLSLIKWAGRGNEPTFPQPTNLPPDGKGRLFFESQDALSPRDSNGRVQDVYEWEPSGVGDCKRPGGCVRLISSGSSPNDSMFLDASDTGEDAFFVTREQLLAPDKDDFLDLYDARVNGGIPSQTETLRSECQGEACQPAAVLPSDPTPSSSSFHGQGNVKQTKAKKHKKKRHRRHAKKRNAHRRAANTNRGGAK